MNVPGGGLMSGSFRDEGGVFYNFFMAALSAPLFVDIAKLQYILK